jgi:serine/threonine protein kinase
MFAKDRGSRVGTRFGPYELRSLIGAGGTGEVYRAYDTTKGRTVAVKVLRNKLAADPGFRERFGRESQLAARLRDPHVIPVHDFGEIDGVLFVDMRLVSGGSLKDLLRAAGALEPARAVSITAQVAAALDAARADGLVHRDVKPGNVLLTPRDFAYLVDFGIAHAGGSYAYRAPEELSGGGVGPQADVYSLACVLYECLTGEPPFESADPQQLMSAHMYSPPPRPSIMRRGIRRDFDDVIAVGMAKQPGARFWSPGELASAATAAAASAGPGEAPAPAAVRASPSPTPTPTPTPSPSPSPPTSTRPFSSSYPNPDDTGYSPYPRPAPTHARPGRGRVPLVLTGAALVVMFVAAILAAISALGASRTRPSGTAAPITTESAAPATNTPSLSRPVPGADGLGFVGHPARCDAGNPPAAVVRTAKSLAVVCQTAPASFYYRGERIRDGANIELANAVRSAGGFDVTNPADGTRYEVRPERLRIISNGHVDSSEPVLEFATTS